MTDTTQNQAKKLVEQRQALREQLQAITSQSLVLTAFTASEEQTGIVSLVQDVRDLVAGVESIFDQSGTFDAAEKARRTRAEMRLSEEICQRVLSLKSKQCVIPGNAADEDLHVVTIAQKARVQAAENALARNVCRISRGQPIDSGDEADAETLRTMLISYAPNQGILNIAIDTGARTTGCKCDTEAQTRQTLTFAMQVETICRMVVDLLNAAGY